jgi:hypothetical protein
MTNTNGKTLLLKIDNVVWREVDEELVILELPTTTYLTLNGSAKQLWLRLAEGATSEDLALMLSDRYGISQEQAASDTESFLSDLDQRQLLDRKS